MPSRFAPASTLDGTCSKVYSGVCTPITSSPSARYAEYQALTCAMARWQLMQEYAQKSTSTTLPRNDSSVSGALPWVLNHWLMPPIAGAGPQSDSPLTSGFCAQASSFAWSAGASARDTLPASFSALLSPEV